MKALLLHVYAALFYDVICHITVYRYNYKYTGNANSHGSLLNEICAKCRF